MNSRTCIASPRSDPAGLPVRLSLASWLVAFLTPLLAGAVVTPALAANMYRYINEQGNLVVTFQVPPERVAQGYEVLNDKGQVIDVIPPAPNAEQRADLEAQERRAANAEAERQRLQAWDERLLLRYSTIEDIEAARDRALSDLKIRVSILKGKQRSLKQQVESYQAQAADQERLGREVDGKYLSAIEDLRSEIAATDRAIVEREHEIEKVEAEYQRDIDRFATLIDVVEMRRGGSSDDS